MAPATKNKPKPAAKKTSAKPRGGGKPKQPAKPKPAAKKPSKPRAAKPAKLPKLPIAIVRELGAALERNEPAWQVQGLTEALGKLGAARAPAAAAALLAQTKKGSPLARAYLTALDDGDKAVEAANQLVRHCATMERGRKALRGAFVAVWRKATDIAAIADACENFARGLLDDPELLDAAVDAGAKLGDTAGATSLAARLERAQRLRPLLEDLAGAAPQRARAKQQLAALAPHDRWHVYARVVDNPRAYDQEIAVDAVRTLADDPNVTDMALSSAIVDMRYHGNDKLIAGWKSRIAAGESATVMRVLGLFEWTALWATDSDQLEPYIHALYPAGGRPEVFASVEHALAGNSVVVRQAVLEEWLRAAEGIRAFDDAQVDQLVRMTVTIAEAGDDTEDRRAANRALFYTPHPGARVALMDALRNASTTKNDELRYNLYFGLSHIDHPDVLPFLVDRMFTEREEYWALLEALEAKIDATANVRVLGTLVERAADPSAVHAATVYADALIHKKQSPRLLIDLARVVIGWQPTNNDDARRLRYIFEQATLAALDLMRPDDARTFLARARELPDSPYSDYLVRDRDEKTPAALANAETKKRIAALEAGKLDDQIIQAREAAEAARAAGKPIAADDARLGTLAGCKVSGRFFEDRDARVVWFFDEVGALHVYDGYAITTPGCQVSGTGGQGIAWNGMAAFIAGHPMIDERALFFDAKTSRAREIIRLGDRLLVHDGSGKDYWEHIAMPALGLKFATTAEARHMFQRLIANPPPGTKRVDTWYLEGAGAIRRKYYCPLSNGDHNDEGEARLAVLGRQIDGSVGDKCPPLDREFATGDAAIAAMEAWETRVLSAGGRITHLWIDAEATRREDTLVSTFLDQRYRDDTQSAAWHLQSLGEMYGAIAEAGLAPLVPDIQVRLGPPATQAEIAMYEALIGEPLPEPLLQVWREVGGGGFMSNETSVRFLSPAELVAGRSGLRKELRFWIDTRLKGQAKQARLAIIDDLDVIAVHDDVPLIIFDTKQRNRDGRCFCSADSDWWESALGWQIATDINVLLHSQLQRRLGDVFRLKLGQR
ncbi:MAG TPA: SMI1/KNR4 family protein, partial [Kofleriaceae bacterium]